MLKLIRYLKPAAPYMLIVWALVIAILSSLPSIPELKIQTRKVEIRLDYLIHICEYGLLAFLAFLTFTAKNLRVIAKRFFIVTVCLVAFAFLDEFHQKFIPGRAFNVIDAISDMAGIFSALVFCVVLFRRVSEKGQC